MLFPFESNYHDTTFARCKTVAQFPTASFHIFGAPYDGATTNRTGARQGPLGIRQASRMLCDATHPYFLQSLADDCADGGDFRFAHTDLTQMRQNFEHSLKQLGPSSAHRVILGGDHSITLPILRVLRQFHAEPLALIHFDAHCDTWSDHFSEPSGHGTWLYEAVQEGLVAPARTVQIGIRSAAMPEAAEFISQQGGLIYTARQLRGLDGNFLSATIEQIRNRIQQHPVYLSFDIDVLDPAFAPGTGTPEVAGLTSSQCFTLIEELSELRFVGMDLCEVAPAYDHAELTTLAASQIVWTYLAGQIMQRKKKSAAV